jgi:ABC-type nitrate/sulfonate/bicarbonate transport system permease component
MALLLALWQAATWSGHAGMLPTPLSVLRFVGTETSRGDLVHNIAVTLGRAGAAFALAFAGGAGLGILFGRFRGLDLLFEGWVTLLLNTPALVIAVLCFLWLGLTETAAITAVALNKAPMTLVIVRQGVRARDPLFDEMSAAFRFSRWRWFRHILLPQLTPFLLAAARSGLAITWKIVLVVELLGRPDGVGFALSSAFQLFDLTAVLGYSLSFAAVMLAIELFVLKPIESFVSTDGYAPS